MYVFLYDLAIVFKLSSTLIPGLSICFEELQKVDLLHFCSKSHLFSHCVSMPCPIGALWLQRSIASVERKKM